MRLTYHPKADEELTEAARFYELRSPELGQRFLLQFDAIIDQIQRFPGLGRLVDRNLRSCSMQRFPFSIYYRIDGEDLRIMVVKHHMQNDDWRDRLDE